jgi:hypothetical protein
MAKQHTPPRPSILDRIELALSTGWYFDGIWIGSYRTPSDLRRVEDALLLIKQHSSLDYSRVVRDLTRVWVSVLPGNRAQYERSSNACMLDERYVANSTVEQIASTIIHEATHARLERLGIAYKEDRRPRIEAICLRREIAFAAKLPNSAELQDSLVRSLEFYGGNNEWFSDASFRERYKQGSVEALRYMETPEWMVRVASIARSMISELRRFYRRVVRLT